MIIEISLNLFSLQLLKLENLRFRNHYKQIKSNKVVQYKLNNKKLRTNMQKRKLLAMISLESRIVYLAWLFVLQVLVNLRNLF